MGILNIYYRKTHNAQLTVSRSNMDRDGWYIEMMSIHLASHHIAVCATDEDADVPYPITSNSLSTYR